jgi:hypothetical protein
MRRTFAFRAFIPELEILMKRSVMTAQLRELIKEADYYLTLEKTPSEALRKGGREPVVAATDPWSALEYQSLYLKSNGTPEDRLVLQEPSVKDPMFGVLVLKAARLRDESGLVYSGTPEQLETFKKKLLDFEQRGAELDEKEFLQCLAEAVEAEGMKVIYEQLSELHGGEPNDVD